VFGSVKTRFAGQKLQQNNQTVKSKYGHIRRKKAITSSYREVVSTDFVLAAPSNSDYKPLLSEFPNYEHQHFPTDQSNTSGLHFLAAIQRYVCSMRPCRTGEKAYQKPFGSSLM